MLRSDLCDYSDAYIVVKGEITVKSNDNAKRRKYMLHYNALFRSCISKINNTFMDISKDLDIVMPMCNLLEYNNNYDIRKFLALLQR